MITRVTHYGMPGDPYVRIVDDIEVRGDELVIDTQCQLRASVDRIVIDMSFDDHTMAAALESAR